MQRIPLAFIACALAGFAAPAAAQKPIRIVVPNPPGGTVDIGAYEFVSPELLVQRLIELVNESSLSTKRPLLASLEAALSSLERENTLSAINQLRAFQNKVRAQVEPVVSAPAAALIQSAEEIIDAIGGGNTSPLTGPQGQLSEPLSLSKQ